MFLTKRISAPAEFKAEDGDGSLSAVFSTFGVVDSDGDILTREAFTDGQPAPMVWAHDWTMPIGKGVVKVEPERAVFKGRLWLDTDDGMQAYRKIKNAGELQEYSWGFRILDAEPGDKDGMAVRYITKAELFEVSPVLVGANRETYTLAIKSGAILDPSDLKGRRRLSRGQIEAVITTLQALLGDDEAEALIDEPAGDDGKARSPLEVVDAYVAGLADVDEAALLDERERIVSLLDETRSASATLDALLKRVDDIGADDPRLLFAQFNRLAGLYGPVHSGRRAG